MSGFFQKLRAVTLGAAHDLLDKEINMNSPSLLRQYVRDLEDAIGKMNSEAAVQFGGVRTLTREYGDLGAKIAADKEAVKKILATNPELAKSKAALIVQNQKHFEQMGVDIVAQQKVADELALAVSNLQTKHDLMVSRVRELERIDRDSKAKESAASALSAAGSLVGSVGSESVDDLESRMRRRNDVANAKFDQSIASVPADDSNSDEVDALLASLKGDSK
jgi:phage shock protein A